MCRVVASQAFDAPWNTLLVSACTVAIAVSHRRWVQRTGVQVLGITPKRARWVALGLGVVMIALVLGCIALKRQTGMWWIPLVGGVVGVLVGHYASRLWLKVYRAELAEGA